MSGRVPIAAALLAALALVGLYLALGGGSYAPAAVADPCERRPWREPDGVQENVEQFSLSALDGAACELHVSRETLAVALASAEGRERFAEDPRLERAARSGLLRAIDDAERAGALDPLLADGLRELAERAPAEEVVSLVRDAGPIFDDVSALLETAEGLLEGADDLLP